MKFGTDHDVHCLWEISLNFSKIKVRTAVLKIFHLKQLGRALRYLYQIWQSDRGNFDMEYDFQQNSR